MELYKQFPNFPLLPPQNILEDILEHHESMNGVTLNLRDLTRLRKQPYKPPLPSLFLTNARSIANKMDELRLLAATNFAGRDSCILLVTKTWLHSSIPDSSIELTGYTVQRHDRTSDSGKSRGGGLCVYVHNNWWTNILTVTTDPWTWRVWLLNAGLFTLQWSLLWSW